jgi:hypothetical protein
MTTWGLAEAVGTSDISSDIAPAKLENNSKRLKKSEKLRRPQVLDFRRVVENHAVFG